MDTNILYYGNNLKILREYIPSNSIDLIYLDPPFNSKATYNVLFKEPNGQPSQAQITAFEDTWHWTSEAEQTFQEIVDTAPANVIEMMTAFRKFIHENDMMAYLAMMCIRLLELKRVLKYTGSIYLHCDPTASHYLKILMDAVFGAENFKNEIIWKRANAHNDPKRFGRISDTILYYIMSGEYVWNTQHTPYREEYYESHFSKDADGRLYRTVPLDAPRHGEGSPNLIYEWHGKWPAPSRTWSVRRETMGEYEHQGLLRYTKTGTPTLLQYADKMSGVPLQNIWVDIPPVNPQAHERLGYPTQKPEALLERIINASSNEGDIVLDPFCGCGTAIVSAQKLKRRWVGIDITHLAISTMKWRLDNMFPNIQYKVIGEPTDLKGAEKLASDNKYQFQWWVVSLIGGKPYGDKKKGADTGIDGYLYFYDWDNKLQKAIISVKGGENIGVQMIRELCHVVDKEKAQMGIFIALQRATKPMELEAISKGFYRSGVGVDYPKIQILTVEELLAGKKPDMPAKMPVTKTPPKAKPKEGKPIPMDLP